MVNVHRLHPDADAGLSQFLMVVAAVAAVKAGKPALVDVGATSGSLLIDGPRLISQMRKASIGQIERALRPLYNES
jgi:hypothetical protein